MTDTSQVNEDKQPLIDALAALKSTLEQSVLMPVDPEHLIEGDLRSPVRRARAGRAGLTTVTGERIST
jgi:hypothetical protein